MVLMLGRTNLKEEVAAALREHILRGALRAGARIDQDQIAEDFGVSRLPVREALIMLEGEGLIHNIPRRGAFVADLTRMDIRDHFVVYGAVARLATERATPLLSAETLDELERILDELDEAADPADQERLNSDFHSMINRHCASRRLRFVAKQLSGSIQVRFFTMQPEWRDVAQKQHREILAALRARDATLAGEHMYHHLEAGGDQAVQTLEEAGFFDRDRSSL